MYPFHIMIKEMIKISTIRVFSDYLEVTCRECGGKFLEEEPFGGVVLNFNCPICGKKTDRKDYSHQFMSGRYFDDDHDDESIIIVKI